MSCSAKLSRISTLLIAIPMLLVSTLTESSQDTPFGQLFADIKALLEVSRTDTLEIQGQVSLLECDAQSIVDFVEDAIQPDLYQGNLRGSRGTLLSRSGNPLDQALLLSEMLRSAGHETVSILSRSRETKRNN